MFDELRKTRHLEISMFEPLDANLSQKCVRVERALLFVIFMIVNICYQHKLSVSVLPNLKEMYKLFPISVFKLHIHHILKN
jgi:hypothetical protein